MKAKRLNKRVKSNKKVKVNTKYVDVLKGRTVILKSIPKNIKRAKRLFSIGQEYVIQKPENNYINSEMSVALKGKDGKIYQIQFMHYALKPR